MKNTTNNTAASINNVYQLTGKVPLSRAIPFGLQHILAMFVANITPIFIVAAAAGLDNNATINLVQCAMIIAGIGTLVQLYPHFKIGSGLPIVMGISFTFVSALCTIAASRGYAVIVGTIIVGGCIEGILGLFAKYWRKIISPIVAACVVTAIGFSLLTVGANSFGGGNGAEDFGSWKHLLVGTITLVCCIAFNLLAKSYFRRLSVLVGLVVGYIVACFLGIVDFSGLAGHSIISLPRPLPVTPQFEIGPIITVTLIFLVSATETIGDTTAVSITGLGRDVTDNEISGSIACDGFVSALSGVFGCLPITSFSQNVGLVAMTKVVNRFVIATGAVIMLLAGFFPYIGALLNTLPESVLGGCTIMMFGNIIVSGVKMITDCGLGKRNTTIAALSLSIGLGFTMVPDIFHIFPDIVKSIFAENCVATVFVIAVILNLVLPKEDSKYFKD